MDVQQITQKKEVALWTLTSNVTHMHCLVWPGSMPAVTSSMYVAYHTPKLGLEPFYMDKAKIKATTSDSSQPGQEKPLPMSQWSPKCQYRGG